jgi:hypothetical protein
MALGALYLVTKRINFLRPESASNYVVMHNLDNLLASNTFYTLEQVTKMANELEYSEMHCMTTNTTYEGTK